MSDAARLVSFLKDHDATVATAESLTGGRLASRITEVPGSSSVFRGGVVSYATEVKVAVLGVPAELVKEYGVVSGECARAMAEGARRLLAATYGISTTGVAGPETQEGKPVGTVFVAVAGPHGTETRKLSLSGERGEIQDATVADAIDLAVSSAGRDPEHTSLR